MSTYLITGIAGFIGSSLARAVLQRGGRVRGIDNFSTGKPENIAEIIDQIDFREADLLDLWATQQACRDVDYVLHEAAIPSVPRSINKPLESNRANVDGTLNLLIAAHAMRKWGVSFMRHCPRRMVIRERCRSARTWLPTQFLPTPFPNLQESTT